MSNLVIFMAVLPQQIVEAEEYLEQARLTFPDFRFGLEVDFSSIQPNFESLRQKKFPVACRFSGLIDESNVDALAAALWTYPLEYVVIRGGNGADVQESAEYIRFWENRVRVLKKLASSGIEICIENASPRQLRKKNGGYFAAAVPQAGMFGHDLAALAEKAGCKTFIDTEHLVDGVITVKEWGRNKVAVPYTIADQICLDLFGFFVRCGMTILPAFMSLDKSKEIKKSGAKRFRITGSSIRIGAGGQFFGGTEINGSDFQRHLFSTVLSAEPVSITVGNAEAGLEAQKRSLGAVVEIITKI